MKSRAANVGDKLTVTNFNLGTRGFAGPEDANVAVCVLPGTELAFDAPISSYTGTDSEHKTAVFRQINKDQPCMHHDALELPDGTELLLTYLREGQTATVLQLPAAPQTADEAKEQERVAVVA